MRGAGAAYSNDRKGLAFDWNRTNFLQALGLDDANQRMPRIGNAAPASEIGRHSLVWLLINIITH
ncbi:hypothetical protein Rleg_6057 (plasmid) [Rhizobium leguminosarum bv. trifolii WSM1325]|uniref:Uncharacterized protein n=1 Tax=Rhizobium leguminosarum bv. trifolii (strain WSM1325) TaxID=395491 RepID=C6BA73_RHILS|nr:hypothetical protein Rleg_6057 [Rhizobium leguminosarum bv. trifolii WSM1325]